MEPQDSQENYSNHPMYKSINEGFDYHQNISDNKQHVDQPGKKTKFLFFGILKLLQYEKTTQNTAQNVGK